ncbi:hypothetical protein BGZ58_009523 [Dissophora ornata]|nr:hypothetical protein BGZ58_009523 [Dissophora ornata]
MEHINKVCEQEGYPIVVENSPTLGNHAKAARDIPQGEGLLRAVPYAAEVLDSYKKRMCHVCLLYHGRGSFSHRCQDCDQVYYCSLACKTVAMDPLAGAHGKICKTLRKLATWDSNRHTKSIIKLLLQVLMGHWRERQGIPSAYKSRRLFQEILEKRKASDESAQVSDSESLRLALDLESKLDIINQNKDAALATRELYDETASVTGEKKRNDVETKQDDETLRVQEPVENDFYDFLRLQSHFEDWDEDDTKDWDRQSQIVLSFLEIAGLTEIAAERDGPLKKLTSLDVKRLISVLESNAFGMFDCSKKKEVCFGRAIYPVASFFNHSCECNVTAVQADGTMEEVTGADVLVFINAEETLSQSQTASTPATSGPPPAPPPTLTAASGPASSPNAEESDIASKETELEADIVVDGDDAGKELEADPYDSRVGEFRMMTFYAVKDIPKGHDVTISYIDTGMPLHARRLALLSDYHFHCCCERCLREEKLASLSSKKASKNAKRAGGGGGSKNKAKADKKSGKKSK